MPVVADQFYQSRFTEFAELVELQVARPVLQEIYDDGSVMNVVRARAQRIMEMGNGVAAAH